MSAIGVSHIWAARSVRSSNACSGSVSRIRYCRSREARCLVVDHGSRCSSRLDGISQPAIVALRTASSRHRAVRPLRDTTRVRLAPLHEQVQLSAASTCWRRTRGRGSTMHTITMCRADAHCPRAMSARIADASMGHAIHEGLAQRSLLAQSASSLEYSRLSRRRQKPQNTCAGRRLTVFVR
jgi:hypothetical protein